MKAATTWVWHQLQAHPEIRMPWQKELHYFDHLQSTPEHYFTKFQKLPREKLTGEVTPAYFSVPHAPQLVRALCPKAKLWVILRNPADRAFSHWKIAMWMEAKIPLGTPFRVAFDKEYPHGVGWISMKDRGLYFKHLRRWYAAFPEEQIKVMWYEDLAKEPEKFLKDLYTWLGLKNVDFLPRYYKHKQNENWSGRNPKFKPEDREYLLNFYKPSIERLEKLTGRDLSSWKP